LSYATLETLKIKVLPSLPSRNDFSADCLQAGSSVTYFLLSAEALAKRNVCYWRVCPASRFSSSEGLWCAVRIQGRTTSTCRLGDKPFTFLIDPVRSSNFWSKNNIQRSTNGPCKVYGEYHVLASAMVTTDAALGLILCSTNIREHR